VLSSTVSGIPCQIKLISYVPSWDGKKGHIDHWLPDEPEEIEFEVYDRKGYRAEWLERKISDKDRSRIEKQLMEEV